MLKFLTLGLKNLGRNKIRTTLTALAVLVLVAIYAVVTTVTNTVRDMTRVQAGETKLVVTERWILPSQFPIRYVPELTNVDGIEDWTVWHFYPGFFDDSKRQDRRGPGIATKPENLIAMHDDLEGLDPGAVEALKREKSGALVGGAVLEKMNWQIGDQFQFVSVTPGSKNLEFKIVGSLPPGMWSNSFFFREDYYVEATGDDTVTMAWLRVSDPAAATQVAAEIQRKFENRQPELKVETESASISRFAERNQTLVLVIELVVAVLLIDMTIVLSNSIGISTRERRGEMAVLKVLGFQPVHIVAMVIGEAMFVGGLSGLAGGGLAWGFSQLTLLGLLPATRASQFVMTFPIPASVLLSGLVLGALVGLAGSVLPAWNARKVKVSDVFANIA